LNTNDLLHRIKQYFPDLEIHQLVSIGSGQFNHILLINNELVFRFPRYAHVMDQWEIRQSILDYIREQLPLPVPEMIYQSPNNHIPGEVFSVFRMIPGKPLYRERLVAIDNEDVLQRLAEQAAGFLKALHWIDIKGLGETVPAEDPLEYYEHFFEEVRTTLLPKMRPSARLATEMFFEQLLSFLRHNPYQPCLIHNDFGGSNILYDEDRQQLNGVIDFNSLCLADPAVDVASLSTYGEDFVNRGLCVYPEMKHLMERARLIRGTFALEEALSGWKDGDAKAYERGMEKYV
jgi:aminoglycoside phosphotransferase (APT) family kinase protein